MKKSKIAIICLLAISLCFVSGCGCGKQKEKNEKQEKLEMLTLSESTEPISDRTGLSFDMSSNTRKYYTVIGETEDLQNIIEYNSTIIANKLLGSEDMKISYTSKMPHTLILLCDESTPGTITINGKDYEASVREFKIELEAGDYEITSKDVDIYYILVEEINHTITVDIKDVAIISFNLDGVEESTEDGFTIYTFWDGTKIRMDSENTATLIEKGTNDIFGIEENDNTEETIITSDAVVVE